MATSTHIHKLSPDTRKQAHQWAKEQQNNVPAAVYDMINGYEEMLAAFEKSKRSGQAMQRQLLVTMGINPSSEKRPSNRPQGEGAIRKPPKVSDPHQQALQEAAYHRQKQRRSQLQARKHGTKARKAEFAAMSIKDIELTAQDLAEVDADVDLTSLLVGTEGQAEEFKPAKEPFLCGYTPEQFYADEDSLVPAESYAQDDVLSDLSEKRTRFEFGISLTTVNVNVQKLVVRDGGGTKILTGSTQHIGPAGASITWGFQVNLLLTVCQVLMPFNRLATLLSTPEKSFTADMLSKWFCKAADHMAPVYLYLAKQLANSALLSGDDTKTRCVEVNRYMKALREDADEAGPPPWAAYANAEVAGDFLEKPDGAAKNQKLYLGAVLAKNLGFVSEKRTGEGGAKVGMNTTVLIGRAEQLKPNSTIIFYRSHFGGLGNLLTTILKQRTVADPVTIQADLATVNLVDTGEFPENKKNLKIDYAGCASHARRPFAIYQDEDPDNADYMLCLFSIIFGYEAHLDGVGRNFNNTLAVRTKQSSKTWEEVLELAKRLESKWPPDSPLGRGSRYIIKNYDKLTHYLTNPYINISNDFSERMLRPEKRIQDSALFRWTLRGRFSMDVNRTLIQTAIAAGANPDQYVRFVLTAPAEDVKAHPEKYTPLAFLAAQSEQPKT